MINLQGEIKEIKVQEFESEGSKRTVFDLIVDVGRSYPEIVRVSNRDEYEVGDTIDLDVRCSAYSRSEKKYLKVIFYPLEK